MQLCLSRASKGIRSCTCACTLLKCHSVHVCALWGVAGIRVGTKRCELVVFAKGHICVSSRTACMCMRVCYCTLASLFRCWHARTRVFEHAYVIGCVHAWHVRTGVYVCMCAPVCSCVRSCVHAHERTYLRARAPVRLGAGQTLTATPPSPSPAPLLLAPPQTTVHPYAPSCTMHHNP